MKGLLNFVEWLCWSFVDEDVWISVYLKFFDYFEKGDSDWEEFLFKVWVVWVLNYIFKNVMCGYDSVLGVLCDLVWDICY